MNAETDPITRVIDAVLSLFRGRKSATGEASASPAYSGVAESASAAIPGYKCKIADRWFYEVFLKGAASAGIPIPTEKWERYTCSEKNLIMANPAIGLQAVELARAARQFGFDPKAAANAAGAVANAAKKSTGTVKKLSKKVRFP